MSQKNHRLVVRIDESMAEALRYLATMTERERSDMVREALREYINKLNRDDF
jgi:predicted DNA-binding protein